MFIFYQSTEIDSIKINQLFNNQEARLLVTENYTSALLGLISSRAIRVNVVNSMTDKKLPKRYWNNETLQLAARLKKKHQPTFFQRWGKIILMLLIVLIAHFAVDYKTTVKSPSKNFAICHDPEIKQACLDELSTGDFILCSKDYNTSAQVYKIGSMTNGIVILQAFNQFIPREEFQDLDKLNTFVLGNTDSKEVVVKRKYFTQGILEDIVDNTGLNNQYIQQIKKK